MTSECLDENNGTRKVGAVLYVPLPVRFEEKLGNNEIVQTADEQLYKESKFSRYSMDYYLAKLDFHFWGYTRYLVLFVCVLCMTAARSNELTFSFNVICMTAANSTYPNHVPLFMTPDQISTIFSSSGVGAIVMVIPILCAIQKFGAKAVFATLLTLSSFASVGVAYLGKVDISWLVVARVLQGFAMAAVMPLMGYVSSQWAPIEEVGNFLAILSSSGQFSQLFTLPVSANLCLRSGWESIFIFHGLLSIGLVILFIFFFRNSPREHPFTSKNEVFVITEGIADSTKKEKRIPYYKIFTSRSVWAVWISFLGNSFGFQIVVQFMPTFLNKVLGVSILKSGVSVIFVAISQLVFKLIAGIASDRIKFISEKRKLQIFNSIALVGAGLFLIPLGFLTPDMANVAIFCFTMSISTLGITVVGSLKSATLIARSYTHCVMSIVQLVIAVGMVVTPYLVSKIAPQNTIAEWRVVFIVIFVLLFVSNLFFVFMCSDKPEIWSILGSKKSMVEFADIIAKNKQQMGINDVE
uniref:MFS domain-containing protein n=1 Tax=Rhabditophanes sp. KR3021 TaxID=114890 RepID=A0AC35TWA1_9BILA